ncbi:MAG TPA: ABC transporter ATP-binding protein, partial [Elusimicrobiota bacterium]|nr:ABC transporter ATP-binding protein [Elusimicrobiota bacterium]
LDEPTANLDPDKAERVRAELTRLHRERNLTILYTSHNMAEVQALCGRAIFMRDGRAVADGATAELPRKFGKASLEEVFLHLAREKAV